MTVDVTASDDTAKLILLKKTFYPAKISISHYQLRHYISSPEQDIVYYASGKDVYSINTASKERHIITSLPFETRCTASAHGWICVGGNAGELAVIQVQRGSLKVDMPGVDDSLPLSFRHPETSRQSRQRPSSASQVKIERIGREIVNSISIHKITENNGTEDVQAVLTNNDKTVRIYSLTLGFTKTVLDLPFALNHATFSPNGQYLAVVGDVHRAFFFERNPAKSSASKARAQYQRGDVGTFSWSAFSTVELYVPKLCSTTGYFTTAWSPSGHLVAVGSECGYITVFDVDILTQSDHGEDAIVRILKSTRPDTTLGPGAVRTMCFSPQPWDMLFWTEDHGRVCGADLRTGLQTGQIVELDTTSEGVRFIDLAERDRDSYGLHQGQLNLDRLELPRARDPEYESAYERILDAELYGNELAVVDIANEYMGLAAGRRGQTRPEHTNSDLPHGLTEQESQILDNLRITRQRSDAIEQDVSDRLRAGQTRPVTNPSSEGAASGQTRRTITPRSDARDSIADYLAGSSGRSNSINAATRGIQQLVNVRDALRERDSAAQDPERGPLFPPRRDDASRGEASRAERIASASRTESASPTRTDWEPSSNRTDPQSSSSSDAWRTIETALSRTSHPSSSRPRRNPPVYASQRQSQAQQRQSVTPSPPLNPITANAMASSVENRRLRQLIRAREQMARTVLEAGPLHDTRLIGRQSNPEWGQRTAGMAISVDGRSMFVGTEEGIFHLSFDTGNRKAWLSIEPR